ncbi:GNAT family N-acetyltransferase [Marinomonas transparens]|uniref:GNAT family N-acetyltransferase n=1 Tax=Marinomonas transparens TaxID=2795388 RepID=A0A934N3M5_9GAMM|nr:GNAT family N-acetyltransferase [Marinomonas transparens]MBJ7539842.1 GNAT family N-acetyltransferase [Marinomonas transparens]
MAVTTYYLEMKSSDELIEKTESRGLVVQEAKIDEFRFNRFLYQLIGEQWDWTDKLSLSDEEWKAYVESPNVRTWVAYYDGAVAGYFELNAKESGDTEIAYFGLAPNFIGKGFGGYLLSQAISNAWDISSTKRVWVHTCSLDHASALSNYQARGLKMYKEETE